MNKDKNHFWTKTFFYFFVGIYLLSYFIPAYREARGSRDWGEPMLGWQCALFTSLYFMTDLRLGIGCLSNYIALSLLILQIPIIRKRIYAFRWFRLRQISTAFILFLSLAVWHWYVQNPIDFAGLEKGADSKIRGELLVGYYSWSFSILGMWGLDIWRGRLPEKKGFGRRSYYTALNRINNGKEDLKKF